ncbi:nicotinamide riboside kinase 1 [Chrysoperla carnea]|uniref:nicotinamide riboside kinase 1 n=1 Tax=Chrysoperla carnea TaxID=189513 RepID=UPI001D069773|nr:nicotinamide riboside kinase 1 [Chrysoperla carnea]
MCDSWFVLGLSGVTCGGKTTLAKELHNKIPNSYLIHQDNYFLPIDSSLHTHLPELKAINWEILSSLDMEKMKNDIFDLIKDKRCSLTDTNCINLLIIEGFSIFNYNQFKNLFHKMYFLTLPRDICWERRNNRVYDPPDVPGYFDKIVWPHYLQIKEQLQNDYNSIEYMSGVEPTSTHFNKVVQDLSNIFT